ncbi:CU044_2847 family protein [Streptomyces sp. NPDC094038]|uniref:CU044_2847 family protein n=1 Tax=Streptomyces sp. NPDC094038 TaxID=3366055 RepID=UPI0038130003
MGAIARLRLDDGESVLFEITEAAQGPVKAGRTADAVRDLPHRLGTVLRPVAGLARDTLAQLREAGPDEVVIEFGLDMSAEAGAVVAKTETGCHLNVTMTWRQGTAADAE